MGHQATEIAHLAGGSEFGLKGKVGWGARILSRRQDVYQNAAGLLAGGATGGAVTPSDGLYWEASQKAEGTTLLSLLQLRLALRRPQKEPHSSEFANQLYTRSWEYSMQTKGTMRKGLQTAEEVPKI